MARNAMRAAALAEAATVGRLVHDFCWDWAPSHLTSSEHTLRSYRTALQLYLQFLESRGVTAVSLSASHFGRDMVEDWLVWLADVRGNKPQTCNQRLMSLRAFLSYASRKEPTMSHLYAEVAEVTKLTAPKTKVEGLSLDAVRALSHAPDQGTRCGRRDATLIVTLYSTACRISELLGMRVSQLSLDGAHPHATVMGKGGKPRVVHLPETAVDHLREHLAEFHGESPEPDHFLFWSRNHSPHGIHPLSHDAVAKMLQKHAAAASVECPELAGGVTPHRLRHARATHWLDEGMSIVQVSLLLGHADVETTMDYLDISLDSQTDAMQTLPVSPEPEEKKWKQAGASSLLAVCGFTGC